MKTPSSRALDTASVIHDYQESSEEDMDAWTMAVMIDKSIRDAVAASTNYLPDEMHTLVFDNAWKFGFSMQGEHHEYVGPAAMWSVIEAALTRSYHCDDTVAALQQRLIERTEQSMATALRDAETIRQLREALTRIAGLYENPEPPSMSALSARAYDMRCIARTALTP